MKQHNLFGLLALLCGLFCTTASAANSTVSATDNTASATNSTVSAAEATRTGRLRTVPQSLLQIHSDKAAPQMLTLSPSSPLAGEGLTAASSIFSKKAATAATAVNRIKTSTDPSISVPDIAMWDFLTGTDGKDWMFTQTFTKSGYYYTGTTITVYNADNVLQGEFSITIPDDQVVNDIQPYGLVTTKFFDTASSSKEILVYIHYPGNSSNNYTGTHKIYAYRLDGTCVAEYDGYQGVLFEYNTNAYTTVQRMMLIFETTNSDGEDIYKVDIISPKTYYTEGTVVEHTFEIPYDNVIGLVGSLVDVYMIDGEPYYVTNYYEKPYYTGEWTEDYEQVRTDDNSLVVTVYSKDFEQLSQTKIPCVAADDTYRFMGFGFLSDHDLSIGKFTGDDQFNFVIVADDYDVPNDVDYFAFYAYDQQGNLVATIAEQVDEDGYLKLADIEGFEEQYAFGITVDDEQYLRMVNVPSCETVCTIPAYIDGNMISTAMDRYPVGDSYQYVIGLNTSVEDADGNILAQIGWYNTDLTTDHIVMLNLTPNGSYFLPHFSSTTTNPYFFNTDDDHEYVYLSYVARDGSTVKDTWLTVADKDGNEIRSYVGDDTKGSILSAGFINTATTAPSMYIAYYTYNNGYIWNVELYPLPFEKFAAGGDGSESDPYIVSTLGDLQQINNNLTACYKQAADIDMYVNRKTWTPISNFSGTYDGDGYTLSNMHIADCEEYYVGLFGMLANKATIKNLTLYLPEIELNSYNSYVGTLAGYSIGNTFSNVHVFNGSITGAKDATIGGLVGFSSAYSSITACSVNDTYINTPNASPVGGVLGESRTSAAVAACKASGIFKAGSTLGGIVGSLAANAGTVTNCYTDAQLTASNTIGGIVGSNDARKAITNCHASGTITATASGWSGLCLGGITGYLEPDWSSATTAVISGCVANLSAINLPDGTTDDTTVNRIVGYSVKDNEEYVEKGLTENGLYSNYALSTMTIGGQTASGTATDVNGESKSQTEFTADFLASIGYSYGSDSTAPWQGEGLPTLYFEESNAPTSIQTVAGAAHGYSLSYADHQLTATNAARLEVYTLNGQRQNANQLTSGIYVVVVTDNNGARHAQKLVIR